MAKIVVPTDFTTTADIAAKYAIEMAHTLNASVELMHVAKSNGDHANAEVALQSQITRVKGNGSIAISTAIRTGSIFDEIPASAADAELMVMGTHGMTGLQFLIGSNALRVITDSKAPFLVVQDDTKKSANIKKLLLPIDLHKETKQKIKIAGDLALKFGAEIHLVCPKETDEFLANHVSRNIAYSEGYFESINVPYKTQITESKSSGFVKEVIKYAQYAEIDMICILNFATESLIHAFGVDAEQKMITNEAAIPVMVINPVTANLDSRSIFAQ